MTLVSTLFILIHILLIFVHVPRRQDRCISDIALEFNEITITWKRGHWNDLLENIHKTKDLTYFWYFWRHTEHFVFNDKQINPLQSTLQTAQLPGSDSGGSLLSQLNKSGCFRSSYNPQETCISNKPQNKPRAPEEPQASQMVKRILSWPFLGIAIGKRCRKGSSHLQTKKPSMRAESGPGTSTDQNQTERHRSRCLIPASENPARLRHKIRNTCSISEPLGDSKPFQAKDERIKERSVRGTVPSSHAGTEMDPKDFRKGHKHPSWLLCSTPRTYMWLMGLRKPREAVSLCRKQATCKKDRRKRQQLMRLKRIIPSPQGPTGKYRFSCKHTDALDAQGKSFPSIVLK